MNSRNHWKKGSSSSEQWTRLVLKGMRLIVIKNDNPSIVVFKKKRE